VPAIASPPPSDRLLVLTVRELTTTAASSCSNTTADRLPLRRVPTVALSSTCPVFVRLVTRCFFSAFSDSLLVSSSWAVVSPDSLLLVSSESSSLDRFTGIFFVLAAFFVGDLATGFSLGAGLCVNLRLNNELPNRAYCRKSFLGE